MDAQLPRDFMSTYFPSNGAMDDSSVRPRLPSGIEAVPAPGRMGMFAPPASTSSSSTNTAQLAFDTFGLGLDAMNMAGIHLDGQGQATHGQGQPVNGHAIMEQQLRLARLRQLQVQHEILQQQIELISSQNGQALASPITPIDAHRAGPSSYNGLPTPTSSTELRAQPSTEFVSPMALHYMEMAQDTMPNLPPHAGAHATHFSPHSHHQAQSVHSSPHLPPHMWNSAPANLVFNTAPPVSDLDFDISPLTSPWFGATQGQPGAQTGAHAAFPAGGQNASGKRTASPGGDEGADRPNRKRSTQPSAMRISASGNASAGSSGPSKRPVRTSKSASSTPLLRGNTRSRRGSTTAMTSPVLEVPNDTPSPVDLSMPPPAPPSASGDTEMTPAEAGPTPPMSANLTPVTPASIMNLGGMGVRSGLTPSSMASEGFSGGITLADGKGASSTRAKAAMVGPASAGSSKASRKSTADAASSATFKHILPGGTSASASASAIPPKKITNHKESEQKRRDSLKAAYDTLRGLLPPIPLPSEDGYTAAGEPLLPGALPPRGPPRGAGDGPNRGVSKLQLLRCGNEFVKALTGRVERRDEEIGRLRREVARLREILGPAALSGEDEELDLERDVDAVEGPAGVGGAFLASAAAATERAEEEEFAG